MPTLADLDDPRPSRARGFLIGAAVAVPLGLLFWWFASSWLPSLILGNAVEYDARLRQEDAYMQSLCGGLSDATLARDEQLCECVLAVEYPSLDCRHTFMAWTLARMNERCADAATFETALSFCACVQSLDEQLGGLEDDPKQSRQIVQRYVGCTELDDALYLPPVDELLE